MANRKKSAKRATTKSIGKAIRQMIKRLKGHRADASALGKKHIDLNVKILTRCYDDLIRDCKEVWILPK